MVKWYYPDRKPTVRRALWVAGRILLTPLAYTIGAGLYAASWLRRC